MLRKILIASAVMLVQLSALAQTATTSTVVYPKEVKVNWDTKIFENPLPSDEDFILTVFTNDPTVTSIPDLVLMRFLDRTKFYYYNQSITKLQVQKPSTAREVSHKRTVTLKNSATAGKSLDPKTESQDLVEVVENQISPSYLKAVQYKVSALRANFDYCLLEKTNFDAGEKSNDSAATGLKVQKIKGAIGNTWVSYTEATKRNVTVIIGAAYFNAQSKVIRPYLGFRLNLLPINKDMQAAYYNEMHFNNWFGRKILSRLSVDFGLTIASIEDKPFKQYDLFGKTNLLTGVGYKLGNAFFVSAGKAWYSMLDDSDLTLPKYNIKNRWYVSASFDWDIGKSFDSVKKTLGAAL